mmetsp:Transcript_18304/g.58303  ORF Transcript_18304/g.58303 Transcript_18304/m.58303 type:complete len:226 (-) Transcript_18304:25-702(-)
MSLELNLPSASRGSLEKTKSTSSSLIFSPIESKACLRTAGSTAPDLRESNRPSASMRSSTVSASSSLLAIMVKNSGKSIVPEPSTSTASIISCSSSLVGLLPRLYIAAPSSSLSIVPPLSLSKVSNTLRNWSTCSFVSVSAILAGPIWLPLALLSTFPVVTAKPVPATDPSEERKSALVEESGSATPSPREDVIPRASTEYGTDDRQSIQRALTDGVAVKAGLLQ